MVAILAQSVSFVANSEHFLCCSHTLRFETVPRVQSQCIRFMNTYATRNSKWWGKYESKYLRKKITQPPPIQKKQHDLAPNRPSRRSKAHYIEMIKNELSYMLSSVEFSQLVAPRRRRPGTYYGIAAVSKAYPAPPYSTLFGVPGGRYNTRRLWGLYEMHETVWFFGSM